jgi:hypothetical protein
MIMRHDIEAIILYSKLEKRFIQASVNNLHSIGIKVHIVQYTHLWNGTEPDEPVQNHLDSYTLNKIKVTMLGWNFINNSAHSTNPFFWEWFARRYGMRHCQQTWCLLLDGDELVDPAPFKQWLDTETYHHYDSIKLKHYVYSLHPMFQLTAKKHSFSNLVRTSYSHTLPFTVKKGRLNHVWNNQSLFTRWTGKLGIHPQFTVQNGKPFIHHYTNVRTVEEIKQKTKNWGHKNDRDWEAVLKTFTKVTPTHVCGDRYKVVPNIFNLDVSGLVSLINQL